jgi:alpha-glucosidase
MKVFNLPPLIILFVSLFSCLQAFGEVYITVSPDSKTRLVFTVESGVPTYNISKSGKTIIRTSALGFNMKDIGLFNQKMELAKTWRNYRNALWYQAIGQTSKVIDNHHFFAAKLKQKEYPHIEYEIHFKVFNDGVAFKYYWPKQENLSYFELWDELTQFNIDENSDSWWIPAFTNQRYESLYKKTKLKNIKVVHTPLTIKLKSGHLISLHEANLIDYASMAIKNFGNGVLQSDLVPWADGIDVKATTPHHSSWRTILIADQDKDLLSSTLILNLNKQSQIKDSSWIHTGKYIGVWWGMHLGFETWGTGPKHGATTANTKSYIDFASKHGFKGVLVEGWNVGWDGNWYDNGEEFIFNKAYEDYNINFLSEYAKERGVRIIGHHETGSSTKNYEKQLTSAFKFLNEHNIDLVKTGYVGNRLDKKEWHHGQYGVRHYTKVMKEAAKNKVMLMVHEPIKPTGLRRTYPNLISSEGARGQEYNAWDSSGGNPPEHTTILPFTRLVAGPMDFTPGIFDLYLNPYYLV